jgi:hypothetical protein
MKKLIVTGLVSVCVISASFGQGDEGKSPVTAARNFHLFDNELVNIDMKFIDPAKGSVGIDYAFNLSKTLKRIGDDPDKKIDLNLKSNGFFTVTGDNRALNSIVSDLSVKGVGLPLGKAGKLEKIDLEKLLSSDSYNIDSLISLARQRAAIVNSPFWMYFDIHGRHETTQDFRNYDIALGGSLAFSTSYLTALLDFPFGLLRTSENNNPRQLDFSVGYDYVTGLQNTTNAELRQGNNTANRLNFKAEWETGIFKNERVSFLFDSYYELGAPQEIIDSGKDFNYFFQAKFEHLLFKKDDTVTTIAIKYTQGELPPNFDQGYVIGGGFSVDF